MNFADRLAHAVLEKNSALVVGLDPVLERLPREVTGSTSGSPREQAAMAIRRFNTAVIQQVAPHAVAVKPQVAFYEQWGPPGLDAYEHAVATARQAGLLVIGDVKRADIGSTALAYARAHLGADKTRRADAVTVNPWFGRDGIAPFVEVAHQTNGGLFVVVRSSNPSAGELQDLSCDGRPVHEHLAARVVEWGADLVGECGYSSVGAVVGATVPHALQRLRALMPQAWLLLPGVGAQGGRAQDVAVAFDSDGLGALVSASRSILYAFGDPDQSDWREPIGRAAQDLRSDVRALAAL